MTKKQMFKELGVLFEGWELLIYTLFLMAGHFGMFFLLTKSVLFSIIIALVGATFFFRVFVYPNRKLKNHEDDLSELLKYVTNMVFYMRTGSNVLNALQSVKNTVSKRVGKDVQKTIDVLESEESRLDTEHFKAYEFGSLNQFHQNLLIKFDHGGDVSDLFSQIQKNMIFELKKRDELYRKRKGFAMNVYTMIGLTVGIMLILRFNAPFLWDIFMDTSFIGMTTIAITYIGILINLHLLQKHNLDISVRL